MLGLVHEQKEPVLKGKTDADEAEANSALCQLNLTLCIQGVRGHQSGSGISGLVLACCCLSYPPILGHVRGFTCFGLG